MAPLASQKVPNGVDVIIETNIDDTERIVIFRSECSVYFVESASEWKALLLLSCSDSDLKAKVPMPCVEVRRKTSQPNNVTCHIYHVAAG